jgi:8-oxo-dGTP pyrophosphatase MutT (NUDIX family)
MQMYERGAITSVRALIAGRDGALLLLKRQSCAKTSPGEWEFPGGRVEISDPNINLLSEDALRAAAIREVEEETGLMVILGGFCIVQKRTMFDHEYNGQLHLTYAARGLTAQSEVELNPSEHDSYVWHIPFSARPPGLTLASALCLSMYERGSFPELAVASD